MVTTKRWRLPLTGDLQQYVALGSTEISLDALCPSSSVACYLTDDRKQNFTSKRIDYGLEVMDSSFSSAGLSQAPTNDILKLEA